MALSYKKDLGKYKDIDEDEILNKLSAEELKQLETALEEMDPEVRMRELEELQERKSLELSKCIICIHEHPESLQLYFLISARFLYSSMFDSLEVHNLEVNQRNSF